MLSKTFCRSTYTMIQYVVYVSCLVCLLFPSIAFSQAQAAPLRKMTDAQIIQDLESHLNELAAQDKFSGAVLLAKNDKILFEQAYGFANHAFDVRNRVETKFNMGSMGKMFTAVAILQLVQTGKLSLNDTLIKDLPDYSNKEVASKITIYQLLTHTSGIGGDIFTKEFQESSMIKFGTLESLLPLFVNEPLEFEPGAKWSYSNAGFIVLGLVVQHASGQSYYDYVREHIFKPAAMTSTDNYSADADVPNLALGYTRMGAEPDTRRSNIFSLQRGGSAGGGYSTVGDLLRFSRALQSHKLLNPEFTKMIMTGKVATQDPNSKYGFGMEERFERGVRIVGHSGGGPGISSNLDMYPDLGYTAVVMSNYDQAAMEVNARLRLELSGQRLPEPIHLSSEVLQALAGKYAPVPPPEAPPGTKMPPMEITADKDGLWLNIGMKRRLLPISPTEFFDESNPSIHHIFTWDAQGQVTMTVTGLGHPMKAIKIQERR